MTDKHDHILSFQILDDLCIVYNDYVLLENLERETIMEGLFKITYPFSTTYEQHRESDPTGYYFENEFTKSEISDILDNLIEEKYDVWNRYEKYYVIAYAIDLTRFEVFSKDYDNEIIDWPYDERFGFSKWIQGHITGRITDSNYNENPVISALRALEQLND